MVSFVLDVSDIILWGPDLLFEITWFWELVPPILELLP